MSPKLEAGLSMVADAREGEWQQCAPVLSKLLGNILANPGEPKYRTIRTTNAKIASCLATRGARAVLVGVGFVEAGEQLTLPDDAPTTAVQAGLDGLEALNAQRLRTAQDEKEAEIARRKEEAEKENEERKRMRSGIADDASARKEPGWTAKAAGVKGGKAITSCSDIGIGQGGGG